MVQKSRVTAETRKKAAAEMTRGLAKRGPGQDLISFTDTFILPLFFFSRRDLAKSREIERGESSHSREQYKSL